MAWSLFRQSQVSPKSWASSLLSRLGAPASQANMQSLIAWALAEGGGGTYNPLNTTQPAPGASNLPGNSSGVKDYTSWAEGVTATVQTLNNGYYPNIVAGLKSGRGVGTNSASDLLKWSGQGYSALSGEWSRAAGYLGGKTAPLPGGAGSVGATVNPGGHAPGTGGNPSVIQQINNYLANLGGGVVSSTSTLGDIGAGLAGIGTAVGTLVHGIDWLFVPSHWVRIFAGVGGSIFVIAGAWSLTHVGGEVAGVAVPTATALPMGILFVGMGGVLLFVAFHNLPDNVTSLPALLGHIQSGITTKAAA